MNCGDNIIQFLKDQGMGNRDWARVQDNLYFLSRYFDFEKKFEENSGDLEFFLSAVKEILSFIEENHNALKEKDPRGNDFDYLHLDVEFGFLVYEAARFLLHDEQVGKIEDLVDKFFDKSSEELEVSLLDHDQYNLNQVLIRVVENYKRLFLSLIFILLADPDKYLKLGIDISLLIASLKNYIILGQVNQTNEVWYILRKNI